MEPTPPGPDLPLIPARQLAALKAASDGAQKLSKAAKLTLLDREEALGKFSESLRTLDLPGLTAVVEAERGRIKELIATDLKRKRELVLQTAESMGQPVRRYSDYDRIGPFRITHQGASTKVAFGRLAVESFDEANGEKAAERIVALRKETLEGAFDPRVFYHEFQQAVRHASVEDALHDGWVRLDAIYREFALGQMRSGFGKRGWKEAKPTAPVPLVRFVVQFARLLLAANYPKGQYLRIRTPAMALSGEAFQVPDLGDPLGDEKLVLDVKIERNP